jgi:hypothetical protein
VIHRNFQETKRTLIKFQELNERVERLKNTLDHHHRDLLGPAPELLSMHQELFSLQQFRDETIFQVKDSPDETVNTVRAYFRRLDELSSNFLEYLWDLARNILELTKSGQNSVIVRLAKILEFEERADEEALALEEYLQEKEKLGPQASTGSLPNSNQIIHRVVKSYRSKFFDVLHDAISIKFDLLYSPDRDVIELLEEAKSQVLGDLTFVFEQVVDLFPKKYKLFPFYVLEYHRHVYDLINKIILEKMETATILYILRWCRDYYMEMNDKLSISEELLEPRLLDGQESVLVEDYLKLIRQKLDEWMKNLLHSETQDFIERSKQPEMDSQGMYGLSAAVILFNMVNQQIDIVLDSSRGQLLLDVVKECKRSLLVYQSHFMQLVQSEYTKFVQDSKKVPGGIIEYTMALANDSLKCTEFVELIVKRLETEADYTFRPVITEELNSAMDGFMRVSKAACGVLIDASFADIKSATSLMFVPPAWYEGEIMNDIVATMNDYYVDYQEHLQEYLFSKIMTDVMERFLISWIEGMRSKNAKFRIPSSWDIMQNDLKRAIEFFSKFKSPKRVEKHFDIMDKLFTLICANRKMIFLDFYSLWKVYSDIPVGFIEEIIVKRDDMDKSGVKEVMEAIKQKMKEEPPQDSQKSIFSNMNSNSGK